MLDLVAGLVDKSILIKEDHGPRTRYRLLDTLRYYGLDALKVAGAEAALRRRHRDYYLGLAERGEAEWLGPTQREVVAWMRCEHANLRLALEFSLTVPDESQAGLRLASALHSYWFSCGFVAETRHWLDRALALDTEPTKVRATALWINAHLAVAQGDGLAAIAMAQESRDLAERLSERTTLAYALHSQGTAEGLSGDLRRAQTLLEDALARYEALGELNTNVIFAHVTLAVIAVFQGDLTRAIALGQYACMLSERRGEQRARAYALHALALAEWTQGELAQASTHAQEGLRGMQSFHDTYGIATVVEQLAWIAGTAGEGERAAVLLGAASTIWPLVGGRPLLGSQHLIAPHEACEQQVADLVAEGLSNKDIAARLVIAQRTAEGHVARILTKLGFTTRTQLATWVAGQREGRDR